MPEGAVVVGFVAGVIYNASSALLLKLQVRIYGPCRKPRTNPTAVSAGVFNNSYM